MLAGQAAFGYPGAVTMRLALGFGGLSLLLFGWACSVYDESLLTDTTGGGGQGGQGVTTTTTGMMMCQSPSDCLGEDTQCRTRTCEGGMCGVLNVPAGTLLTDQVPGDCLEQQCDGNGESTVVPQNTDIPEDGKECTVDACNGGVASNTAKAPGAACNTTDHCNAASECVECVIDANCASNVCNMRTFVCADAMCGDGAENGDETDLDCGGVVCAPCGVGDECVFGTDCVEEICMAGICLPPACNDGAENGNETDVDCGGACVTNCAPGKGCLANGDCTTGLCAGAPLACACPAGMVIAPVSGGGSYCIDSSEVTRQEYQAFFFANPVVPGLPAACAGNLYPPSADWPPDPGELQLPVAYVDWCDAFTYCRWLGRHLCGDIGGGSSDPADFTDSSENEWFNACTAQGVSTYPYGNGYNALLCNGEAAMGMGGLETEAANLTCQGGSPGLYNMSGNAAEWEDACDMGDQCRVRGGAFSSGPAGLTCGADDFRGRLDNGNPDVGFRCCL